MPAIQELLTQAQHFNDNLEYEKTVSLLTDEILQLHKSSDLYTERGRAYLNLKGESGKGLGDIHKALSLDKNNYAAYFYRAAFRFTDKNYDKAIEDFSKAIDIKPSFGKAYFNRGLVWIRRKMYDNAIIDYDKVIELDPGEYMAYNNRGVALTEKKKFDEAIENYNKSIELNPQFALGFSNKGHALYNKDQFADAIKEYETAISLDNTQKSSLQPFVNQLKLKSGEKIDLQTIVENSTVTLSADFKTNTKFIAIDYLIRCFILILYLLEQIGAGGLIWFNVGLLCIEVAIAVLIGEKFKKKIRIASNSLYKPFIKNIGLNVELNNQVRMLYLITGLFVSTWYFLSTSEHSHWYSYVWIIGKIFAGILFFVFALLASAEILFKYKPVAYKVIKSSNENGKTIQENITSFFPDAIALEEVNNKEIELDDHDVNDIQITGFESDLKAISGKVDAYMLESVFLGALAFSGFLTILVSSIINNATGNFLKMSQSFFKGIQESLQSKGDSISIFFSEITKGENLFLLIMFECLICSVFFILVLTLRLRLSDLVSRVDHLIREMNIFNAKEEELVTMKFENTMYDKVEIEKRLKVISGAIELKLSDTNKLLTKIRPVVSYMSLFRNLGLILFYLVLVSSGQFFSPSVSIIILIIGICTFLFRFVDTPSKFQTLKNIIKKH